MNVVANINAESIDEQVIADLQSAAQKLLEASDSDFERLQSEPWYKRVMGRLAFSDKKGQQVSAQVNTLMQAQICVIKILVGLSARDTQIFDVLKEHAESLERLSSGNKRLASIVIDTQDRIKSLEQKRLGIYNVSDFRELPLDGKQALLAILFKLADVFGNSTSDYQKCYLNWIHDSCEDKSLLTEAEAGVEKLLSNIDSLTLKHLKLIATSCLIYIEVGKEDNDIAINKANDLIGKVIGIRESHLEELRRYVVKIINARGYDVFMPKDIDLESDCIMDFEIDIDFASDDCELKRNEVGETNLLTKDLSVDIVSNEREALSSIKERVVNSKRKLISFQLKEVKDALASITKTDWSFFIDPSFGDGIFEKLKFKASAMAYEIGRRSCVSDLEKKIKDYEDIIYESLDAIRDLNIILANKDLQEIHMPYMESIDLDLNHSVENTKWGSQFDYCNRIVDKWISSTSSAIEDAEGQIDLLLDGKDESIFLIKEQDVLQEKQRKQNERDSKKTALIKVDGYNIRVSMELKEIVDPPCDPDDISHIKTDGKNWIIVEDRKNIFCSNDGEKWDIITDSVIAEIEASISEVEYINQTWIVFFSGWNTAPIYSHDLQSWQKISYPEGLSDSYSDSPTGDIIFFNGLWLRRFTHSEDYEYIKPGFFSNSKETSCYDRSSLYCSRSLNGQWSLWDGSPKFQEGVEIESIHSILENNIIIAFCDYNGSYKLDTKKIDAKPFVGYFNVKKGSWKKCDWEDLGDFLYGQPIITNIGGELSCFLKGEKFVSDKGFQWKKQESEISVDKVFNVNSFVLLFSSSTDARLYFCGDDASSGEIILDEGDWYYFCANNYGFLSVYSPSDHESCLMFGRFNIESIQSKAIE